MNTPSASHSPERPITSSAQDALERGPFVERLVDAIVDQQTRRSAGVVIGITGPWGSGKSSVLNLIEARVRELHRRALILRFDPWLITGRDQLIEAFLGEFLQALEARSGSAREWNDAAKAVSAYARSLSSVAKEVSGLAGSVLSIISEGLTPPTRQLPELKHQVSLKLAATRVPIVVLIDELDRVEDSEVRAVAQLVRAIVDFPGISYVLAYDHERVVEALGMVPGVGRRGARERGRSYLEKIVQFAVPLPHSEERVLRALLAAEIQQIAPPGSFHFETGAGRHDRLLDLLFDGVVSTPRDIKRLVGHFRILESMTRGEVSATDLLGYSAISSKCPDVVEVLRRHFEQFVDDPLNTNLQIARAIQGHDQLLEQLVRDIPATFQPLLRELFPATGPQTTSRDRHPLAICRRRSLLAVLRLGLSSADVPRSSISEMFQLGPEQVHERLVDAETHGRLDQLVDRASDLVELERPGAGFWVGLGNFIGDELAQTPEQILIRRDTVSSVSRMIIIPVVRNIITPSDARSIIVNLHSENEINVVSDLLRMHFFMHGLYGRRNDGPNGAILTPSETTTFAGTCGAQWKTNLLSGKVLQHLKNLDLIFILIETGIWDNTCRSYMTNKLSDDSFVDFMAVLMFGGNSILDAEYVDRIMDRTIFITRSAERRARIESEHITGRSSSVLYNALSRVMHGVDM